MPDGYMDLPIYGAALGVVGSIRHFIIYSIRIFWKTAADKTVEGACVDREQRKIHEKIL